MRNKVAMCFSFIRIKNISKCISKELHFRLFIFLCSLEEKESKMFLGGCDQKKSAKGRLYHISRFFHSRMKPFKVFGVFVPAENQVLFCLCCLCLVPCTGTCGSAELLSSPEARETFARVPCGTEETQRVSQAWRQLHFLELLAPEWSYLSTCQLLGVRHCPALAPYPYCLGGACFVGTVFTLCYECSKSWNFLSLMVKDML